MLITKKNVSEAIAELVRENPDKMVTENRLMLTYFYAGNFPPHRYVSRLYAILNSLVQKGKIMNEKRKVKVPAPTEEKPNAMTTIQIETYYPVLEASK